MGFDFTAPGVQKTLAWLADTSEEVLNETLHLCCIPAPTFAEEQRAAYVAQRMRAIGLAEVQIDELANVTGILGARLKRPTTLVAAHLDTVFPASTPLQVRRAKERLYGPSIGDNSVAVAAMLQVAAALQNLTASLPGRVIFAASVGEEGLGNLCGIRRLMETWDGQIDTMIAVEGHGVDEIRNAGIGSTRLQVTFEGPGGHSWGAFGTPSAIHAMGSAIHRLSQLPLPVKPKTTLNVGVIEGGASVNTIAPRAMMLIDLRSIETASLMQLEARVHQVLQDIQRERGITVNSQVVGQRPAATLAASHPLCQGVNTIRHYLRLRPATFSASSTDANWPLSLGVPSICLGITRGGLAHTVQEYIDTAPVLSGVKQLLLTILYTLYQGTSSDASPALLTD